MTTNNEKESVLVYGAYEFHIISLNDGFVICAGTGERIPVYKEYIVNKKYPELSYEKISPLYWSVQKQIPYKDCKAQF